MILDQLRMSRPLSGRHLVRYTTTTALPVELGQDYTRPPVAVTSDARGAGGQLTYYMASWTRRFQKLAQSLPTESLVSNASELLIYRSDALVHLRSTPGSVVLPGSTEEVQTVVRLYVTRTACRLSHAATAPVSPAVHCPTRTAC